MPVIHPQINTSTQRLHYSGRTCPGYTHSAAIHQPCRAGAHADERRQPCRNTSPAHDAGSKATHQLKTTQQTRQQTWGQHIANFQGTCLMEPAAAAAAWPSRANCTLSPPAAPRPARRSTLLRRQSCADCRGLQRGRGGLRRSINRHGAGGNGRPGTAGRPPKHNSKLVGSSSTRPKLGPSPPRAVLSNRYRTDTRATLALTFIQQPPGTCRIHPRLQPIVGIDIFGGLWASPERPWRACLNGAGKPVVRHARQPARHATHNPKLVTIEAGAPETPLL